MEIREHAERVLFSHTLEDKLAEPVGDLTDTAPGCPILLPAVPTRPTELTFKASGGRSNDFPGIKCIGTEAGRGQILHFFANHELLAAELMALALLRFPDAPAPFRRGLARTLLEEQEHARLYLARMRACGIEFGSTPVSGYFWRTVAGMQSPMDYVSSLSLTFEQANLDFSLEFSAAFAEAGDLETSSLLKQIHQDEISHVAYGLKWFRRWKDPALSDWEAYCRQLQFPLTPRRARGSIWNVSGRKAAGLDDQFIAELRTCGQSKGRTPDVFLFNPFAEAYVARGKAFAPSIQQNTLARDLGNLPQFLCRQDDIVITPRKPTAPFLAELADLGFIIPEFVELPPGGLLPDSLLRRKLSRLRPWAIAPDSQTLLHPLSGATNCPTSVKWITSPLSQGVAQLYRKSWGTTLLRELTAQVRTQDLEWLCPDEVIGKAVTSMDAALESIGEIRAAGHHRIVVKEDLGLAGANALRLWEPTILDSQKRWMSRVFENQGTLVVEPWLERVADFSMQFEMREGRMKLIGFTGLQTDLRGQFEANWAESDCWRRIPRCIFDAFPNSARVRQQAHEVCDILRRHLENAFSRCDHEGPVGVDAFVYLDAGGRPRLKPVVEVNPRYTMGRLTLELMNYVSPGSRGCFRILSLRSREAAGFSDLRKLAKSLQILNPVSSEGNPVKRIRSGIIVLTDPALAEDRLAIFEVTPS
ncbi:MAG: ferritin-like domain-containing protein [Verrucomicrobia bacterium]|nr:ferritin-like domain-containing protein [Verrucomicrobiota bacterium]